MSQPAQPPRRTRGTVLEAAALLLILTLAAYLRFTNLMTNPGWYSDEGTVADIARHMSEGRTQYLALTGSTLLVARFPVVPFLVSQLLVFDGGVMQTLRTLTASLGVLSTVAAYALVRYVRGRPSAPLALLSALLFAIYPPAVFFSRVGFSYNLLTPLVLLAVAGTWSYLSGGSRLGLAVAGVAIGLGSVTDLMMLSIAAPVGIVALLNRPGDLRWWIPLSLAPLGFYALILYVRDPPVFSFDLGFILSLMSAVPWWAQLSLVAYNFGTLALTDPWWIPAILGLLLLESDRWKRLALLSFLLPLLLLARTAGLAGLRLYSISPLFPFIAIGTANLLWKGVPWLLGLAQRAIRDQLDGLVWLSRSATAGWLQTRFVALSVAGTLFLIVLTPFIVSTFELTSEVSNGFDFPESWAYLPAVEAASAIEYVNSRAVETDLVLASPALAWGLATRTADFQQSLAFDGLASVDYPGDVPRQRFAYPAGLEHAEFAVVDPIWREWGSAHIPDVNQMLQRIEEWPVILKAGSIEVRQNDG